MICAWNHVNFTVILWLNYQNTNFTEQEIVNIFSVDPETIGLTLRRFLNVSWILLKLLLTNTSFFPCYTERYFLQSGICQQWKKRSKIISLFGENNGRITFIWYFSHPIRLALKDALKEHIAPVDESQMHLLHLFRNSSKNIEYWRTCANSL